MDSAKYVSQFDCRRMAATVLLNDDVTDFTDSCTLGWEVPKRQPKTGRKLTRWPYTSAGEINVALRSAKNDCQRDVFIDGCL
jgi:hypothetical protein